MFRNLFIYSLSIIPLSASITYNETEDGTISQLLTEPTMLGELGLGVNTVTGLVNQTGPEQADVFSFIVLENQVLTSLVIDVTSMDRVHFFAFGEGASFEAFASDFLIATLISDASNGDNFLVTAADGGDPGNGSGGTGIIGPIGAGIYTVWLNETDSNGPVGYTTTITTAPVPEPSSAVLMGIGLVALLARRKRV